MKKSIAGARLQRRLLEAVTIVVTAAFMANAAIPDSRAAELFTAAVSAPTPVAKDKAAKPTPAAEKPAPSYQERQDSIAKQKPLLATPKDHTGQTQCVSAEFASLAVVYDSIFESLAPTLPAAVLPQARAIRNQTQRDMQAIMVSTLLIPEHPLTLGADRNDPAYKYRTPLSELVVSNLLKVRDGREGEAVPVANLSLIQAVEISYLFIFVGILAPLGFGVKSVGEFPDTDVPIDTLLRIFGAASTQITHVLAKATTDALLDSCVAEVTAEQKELAGKPSEKVRFRIDVPAIVRATADQLALADAQTCTPIGDLSLGRIVSRTAQFARDNASSAADKRTITAQEKDILRSMRSVRIHHHLIPADPADFTTPESLISGIGTAVPIIGGAPIDILLGLNHNRGTGADFAETVSIADLTVTKSLTAAYYSWHLSLYFASLLTEPISLLGLDPLIPIPGPENLPISPSRLIIETARLPLTYGLITYHHVVRSMCLREDDTSGTGLGAELNKSDPEAAAAAQKAATAKAKSKAKSTPKRKPTTRKPSAATSPSTQPRSAQR
ncbi:hypothetical protein [Gordonia hirsuta]|uniref:hypothetical protein n=1 Tax=Gordonia hirsuta TaxID=53427 RepID=UPI0003485078|nr:hypothetical protein [Gordonia hirsuta]